MPYYVSDREDVLSTLFGTVLRMKPGVPVLVNDDRVGALCLERGYRRVEQPEQAAQDKQPDNEKSTPVMVAAATHEAQLVRPVRRRTVK